MVVGLQFNSILYKQARQKILNLIFLEKLNYDEVKKRIETEFNLEYEDVALMMDDDKNIFGEVILK